MAFRIRKYARENRKSWLSRLLASKSEKFLHGFYNQGFYDLDKNGEVRAIEVVTRARTDSPLVVFDVGANRGEWARAVLDRSADAATVYCFEVLPRIAAHLREALADFPNAKICENGLSAETRQVEVFLNEKWDTASSITPRHEDPLFVDSEVSAISCKVETGDSVVQRLGIGRIDLLKIDVEGHEMEVLAGLRQTFAAAATRPRVIQFEYGVTWLPARHTLHEAYKYLTAANYVVGRLHPDGVDFKPYAFEDDHFRMGNYIAVQTDDPLVERFARF